MQFQSRWQFKRFLSILPGSLVFLALAVTNVAFADDVSKAAIWPQFRGPTGDGIVLNQKPPRQFGEEEGVDWKTSLPGKAWSSPVIGDGVVFVTTAIERLPDEEERLQLLRQTANAEKKFKSLAIAKSIDLQLIELDFRTGSVIQTTPLTSVREPDAIHSLNSYASPTPVLDESHVYCHFGTYGTFCVDRKTREIVWTRVMPLEHAVGPGSSPMLHGDKLVVIQDGMEQQYVIALDKRTGQDIWKTARPPMRASDGDQRKAYCTPVSVTDSKGRDQLVCLGSQWIVGLDPESGRELWRLDHGNGFSVVPRPVMHGDITIFSTGFGKPELWAVDISGSGDVTDTHVKWIVKKGIPAKPSPLLLDGLVYVVDDNGIASCLRAEDGEQVWKSRLGGKFSASPLFAGGVLYFSNHEGQVFIIEPGEEFRLVQTNQLQGQIMASPAVVDNSLIIRTDQAVYRF